METTRKRQRANSDGDSVPLQTSPLSRTTRNKYLQQLAITEYDLREYIETLHTIDKGFTVQDLLVHAATKDASTALTIRDLYNKHVQRQRAKIIDFDRYSKVVWHTIHPRFPQSRDSEQDDVVFEVLRDVTQIITKIGDKASAKFTSFATKRSGLETLCKIGKTICLSDYGLGYEVRKQFEHETALEDAMIDIVFTMNDEERVEMCAVSDGRSTFLQKMELLRRFGGECGLFDGLGRVLVNLGGRVGGDGGGGKDEAVVEDWNEHGDGDGEDEDQEEESVASDVPKYNMYGRDPMFDDSEEELEWLGCYDSGGAPKDDAKSRWILDRHERKRARRG